MNGQPKRQSQEVPKENRPNPQPAIIRIFRALKRYQNRRRDTQHQTNERMMARWTRVVGLFTAGLVFVSIATAIIFWRQLNVMQGQLNEMKSQRLISISQTRADLVRDISVQAITGDKIIANTGETILGFNFSPLWKNTGATEARDYRAWFELKVFDIGPTVPRTLTSKDCPASTTPNPPPIGDVVLNGGQATELAKFLPIGNATAAIGKNETKYILMWGHMEYKDIYYPETQLHYDDWCVDVAPNNLQQSLFSFISLSQNIH